MKIKVLIAEIVFIIIIIVLALYNMFTNEMFFNVSVFQVLTLSATVLLTFYFAHQMADNRRAIDMAEKIINKIREEISDCRFYNINTQSDVDYIGIKNRTIANNIDCLMILSKKLKIEEDVKYILDKYNQYETLFGNHITQITHLQNSSVDFKNIIECIDDKCTYITTGFYK